MKMSSETVRGTQLHWLAYLRRTGPLKEVVGEEPPPKTELFSNDKMKLHGEALANSHKLGLVGHTSNRLLSRLTENEGVMIAACNLLTEPLKPSAGLRLPNGEHPEAWRIVGHPHHAAIRPDRVYSAVFVRIAADERHHRIEKGHTGRQHSNCRETV